jgi:MarR family transcriptional regulator for hemolysin
LKFGIYLVFGFWCLVFFSSVMPKKKSITPLPIDAPERRRLPILLRHAWYGLNQAFRRRIAHIGVTPDQFTVMRTLLEKQNEGLIQSELTRLMASDPNTIASLIERMEKAGLVEREKHEKDRRAFRLLMTAVGKRKYNQAREVALELQSEILSVLPEEKREEFLEQLTIVADRCRAATEGASKKNS